MTLDMGGHTLAAESIMFGLEYGSRMRIANRGPLKAGELLVGNQDFDFIAADSIGFFALSNGAGSTAAAGNITGAVAVVGNSRLTLGADLTLSGVRDFPGDLWVEGGAIVDAVRHSISANGIYLGADLDVATPGHLVHGGAVYAKELHLTSGSTASFRAAGTIQDAISLANGSTLTLLQSKGDLTGLTFNGISAESLAVDASSKLVLDFGDNNKKSWIFRWQDPEVGTWEGTLAAMIDNKQISVLGRYGYKLYDSDGYTCVGSAVPVPATLAGLLQLGGIAAAVGLWRRRRGSLA
jgi:hypothetical protein